MKFNKSFLFLVVIVILLLSVGIFDYINQKQVYDFGNVEISKGQFNEIAEVMEGDFELCNIEDDECVIIRRNE